jgi:hypothetical protein
VGCWGPAWEEGRWRRRRGRHRRRGRTKAPPQGRMRRLQRPPPLHASCGGRGQRACSWATAAYLTLLIHAGGRSVDDQWKEGRAAAREQRQQAAVARFWSSIDPFFSPWNRLELPAKKVTPLPPIPKPRSIPSSACLCPIRWGELAVSCPKRLRFRRVIG